ncbi:MAG: hypothetical protein RLY14_308 [Planctomycetota bacterium]
MSIFIDYQGKCPTLAREIGNFSIISGPALDRYEPKPEIGLPTEPLNGGSCYESLPETRLLHDPASDSRSPCTTSAQSPESPA